MFSACLLRHEQCSFRLLDEDGTYQSIIVLGMKCQYIDEKEFSSGVVGNT